MAEQESSAKGPERHRPTKVGVVTSTKMSKTVVVDVERLTAHRIYGRTQRRTKSFMAHDPNETCSVGDRVMIVESPPLSKLKRWRVKKIIEKAQ